MSISNFTLRCYPGRVFAATMIRQSLAMAEKAAASGDVAAMIAAYEDLKGYDA